MLRGTPDAEVPGRILVVKGQETWRNLAQPGRNPVQDKCGTCHGCDRAGVSAEGGYEVEIALPRNVGTCAGDKPEIFSRVEEAAW